MQGWWTRLCVGAVFGSAAVSCWASDLRGIEFLGSIQASVVSPVPRGTDHAVFRELAKIAGVHCRDPDKGEGCVVQDDGDPHAADYLMLNCSRIAMGRVCTLV